jgi:hypothetical protein
MLFQLTRLHVHQLITRTQWQHADMLLRKMHTYVIHSDVYIKLRYNLSRHGWAADCFHIILSIYQSM